MLPPFQNALVLTGPTGSGKTQLGVRLAQRLDAEIVSMDSMALYRHMDIGTAKPTADERASVPHHLVDVLEPSQSASVAWWLEQAKRCCEEIEGRGKQVLFVGGTPLYLKALLCGLFAGPPADETLRRRLAHEEQTLGSAALHQRLSAVDPVCAGRLHPNDTRRIIRALEVFELTHKKMSDWQTQWPGMERRAAHAVSGHDSLPPDSLPPVLWLDIPRAELYDRINRRVEAMFDAGWLAEAGRLQLLDPPLSREASMALGYQDLFACLNGAITREEAIVRVQTRSRNFARRQITWFRHLPGCAPASEELTETLWQPRMSRRDHRKMI
jgi:tRNA dimethylallyltransferase